MLLLAACGSPSRSLTRALRPTGTRLYLAAGDWRNCSDDPARSDETWCAARDTTPHPIVTPPSPWLGTFGLRARAGHRVDLGAGIAVPAARDDGFLGRSEDSRRLDIGLALWLAFGF